MSEKRFELRLCPNGTYYVWENGELVIDHISFDKWHKEDANDLIDLLNEQDKEIGLLRLELETHKHPLWSTREAEKKVNKLADSLANEVKKNGLLNEEINQLRIENMRLKDGDTL